MALNVDDYERIASYLSGELPGDEKHRLEQWRSSDPENERTFQEVAHIWNNSTVKLSDYDIDSELQWSTLQAAIQEHGERKIFSIARVSTWLKIAASLLVLFLIGLWLLKTDEPSEPWITFSTGTKVEMFVLPDSSKVWLNENSSLSYSPHFGDQLRRLRLQGEGYFKVRKILTQPFTVESGETIIQVLGTSFNVKEDGHDVILTVAEGLVLFSPLDSSTNKGIRVKAGERSIINSGGVPKKSGNTDPSFADWRSTNNPVFDQEKQYPSRYVRPEFTWKKNAINQTVISGTLTNSADLASYKNIVLGISYTRASGKKGATRVTIAGPVVPGASLVFEKRLLDIFRDTKDMDVSIESAEVFPSH